MEFFLKIQNLGGSVSTDQNHLALAYDFDVPDDKLLQKRGRLFLALNISTENGFDLKEASSLFLESVQDAYYKLSDETPLHAIESALNRGVQILHSVKSKDQKHSLGSQDSNLSFSFSTALIWNRVLYTSHIGSPAIYLIRGTGARDLAQEKGHSGLWTSSYILENDDVVIIGTESFAKGFPVQEIISSLGSLSSTITTHTEGDKMASILIKTSVSGSKQTTSIADKIKNVKIKNSVSNTLWKLKSKMGEKATLSEKFKFYQSKKAAPVSSISGLAKGEAAKVAVTVSTAPKRLNVKKTLSKARKQVFVGILMLAGIGFANYQLFYSKDSSRLADTDNQYIFDTYNSKVAPLLASPVEDKKSGGVMGSRTETNQTPHTLIANFYDIAKNLLPIGISSTRDRLIILDSSENTLYQINLKTKESSEIKYKLDNPKYIECEIYKQSFSSDDKDLCFIYTNIGFLIINPNDDESKNVDEYFVDVQSVVDVYPYFTTLYILTSNSIYIYKLEDDTPRKWLKDDELGNAKSIAVDNYIYVLAGNDILKFKDGNRISTFKIDKTHLSNPSQIQISETYIYILDGNKVILYDKSSGGFKKEVILGEEDDPELPAMFTLSKDKNPMIIFEKGKKFFITGN